MAGSGFGSSAEGTALQLPVMGDAMRYINPVYTQAPTDNSLSPLAAYQQFMRTGVMPEAASSFKPFVAPEMPRIAMQTFVSPKPSLSSLLASSVGGDSGGGGYDLGGGGGWESGDQASGVTVGGPMSQDITTTDLGMLSDSPSESSGGK